MCGSQFLKFTYIILTESAASKVKLLKQANNFCICIFMSLTKE